MGRSECGIASSDSESASIEGSSELVNKVKYKQANIIKCYPKFPKILNKTMGYISVVHKHLPQGPKVGPSTSLKGPIGIGPSV